MSDPRPRVDRVLPPEASAQAEALNQRFRPALMSFFLRRIHNFAEVEDLTQDVIVRISERAATIDAARPDAYVFQIAANLLRDHWRRSTVRTSYELETRSRSEEHTSELQSLMRISYAVFCLKKKKTNTLTTRTKNI